jgi:ribA/ribD-fused uncharacterized protein
MDNLYLGFAVGGDESLNFLEARLHDLSPFAALEVEIDGVTYKTAEHAYQALRVVPEQRAAIMQASSPLAAWREGQKLKDNQQLLLDIDKEELMEKNFRAKLAQHPYLREVLMATGKRPLVKVMPTDSFWGTGADGTGENRMGKLWMKLRSELQ